MCSDARMCVEVNMKQEKKIKKIIMSGIIGLVLLSSTIGIMFALGLLESNAPIYGEFTYMNDDGSKAKVILSETSVYFDNIDYEGMEEVQATFAAVREQNQNNREYTDDEFEEARQKYLNCMDFEKYYDKKEHMFDETQSVEEDGQYLYFYYVYYPDVDGCSIDICVDIKERILSIGDMEFQYIE